MTTLLVTNDFPPTVGGIQSYLRDFVDTLDPEGIIVFASTQDAQAAQAWDSVAKYRVIRWQRSVMLPTPATVREMQRIIREFNIDTVWFGAAAPLAVMGHAAKSAGASRVIATTHGHEVGWSMLPGARQVLGIIGDSADVVTYISAYTLRRFRRAFGDQSEFVHLPSGVDTEYFTPASADRRLATREKFGFANGPIVVCASRLVPRKGQDQLIRAFKGVVDKHSDARLVIIGQGRYRSVLETLAKDLGEHVVFTGALPRDEMRDLVAAADVVAMPARTRGGGLDVEGLGIVYLEAQSCGVPVIAGASGGAPETVTQETGLVVDGTDLPALENALLTLLDDPSLRRSMGRAGRAHVLHNWTWPIMAQRLAQLLNQA